MCRRRGNERKIFTRASGNHGRAARHAANAGSEPSRPRRPLGERARVAPRHAVTAATQHNERTPRGERSLLAARQDPPNPSTQLRDVGRCAARHGAAAAGTTRGGRVLLRRATLATAPRRRRGPIPSPSARVPYSPRRRCCSCGDRRGAGTCSFSSGLQVASVVVNGLVILPATCLRLCSARLPSTGCLIR